MNFGTFYFDSDDTLSYTLLGICTKIYLIAWNIYKIIYNHCECIQKYTWNTYIFKIQFKHIQYSKKYTSSIHSNIYKCIGHLLIPSNKKWNSQGPFPIFSFCLNVWNKEIWQNFPLIFHFRWHRGCSFVFSISETIKADLVGVVFDKRETS